VHEHVPVTQARAELSDLVSRVAFTGQRIILTRNGKPLAALVPVADLEAVEAEGAVDAAQEAMDGSPRRFGIARHDPGMSGPLVDRPHEIAAEHRTPPGGPPGTLRHP
jgi:prevent-host-death family protein